MWRYKAEISRVVDGDTVDATVDLGFGVHIKERFRLYGINAPESRTRDLEEKKRGKAATAFLKAWIDERVSKGRQIEVQIIKGKGKFGRWLAQIFCGTECANESLVANGHAVVNFYK